MENRTCQLKAHNFEISRRGEGNAMLQHHEYISITEALKGLKARGFTTDFEFFNNALCAIDSKTTFKAKELSIREHHRFEGVRDPDEESIVYAIETNDGLCGTIADAYGIYANPELEAFMEKVKMREQR